MLIHGITMDSTDNDRDDGYTPIDYYNLNLWSNPLFWVNAFRLAVWLYFLPKLNTLPPLKHIGAKFCGYCYAPIIFQSDRKPERCKYCQKRIIWSERRIG
jgi:hypothetical protein